MASPAETLRQICRDLEVRHDLRRGFFGDLLKQTDWAFVIQCHALIEAAVSDALTLHVANSKLRKHFDLLPMSETQIGKMALAKSLGLVTNDQVRFVSMFSRLRNALAHRVGNVNFSLQDHLAALGSEMESWCTDVARAGPTKMREHLKAQAARQPKTALWFATVLMLYHVLPVPES